MEPVLNALGGSREIFCGNGIKSVTQKALDTASVKTLVRATIRTGFEQYGDAEIKLFVGIQHSRVVAVNSKT